MSKTNLRRSTSSFVCGLHFIVRLADQADECLEIHEGMLYKENKVGSLATKNGFLGGESGTTRLIRTVCKAVSDRGCEKGGRMVIFATFLEGNHELANKHIFPFLGNRFNILFLNAAGVFFLYPHLLEFFGNLDDFNRLLNAVNDDLNVLAYRVSCKALGLIYKKETGPLWRKMVQVESNLQMNEHLSNGVMIHLLLYPVVTLSFQTYYTRTRCMKNWLPLLTMMNPWSNLYWRLYSLVFVTLSKRMLYDHLEGVHANPSESLLNEARTVPTTNVSAERDFDMLDRLMKMKPKALDLALEEIIMFRLNKTQEWRDKLSPARLKEVIKMARESKKRQTEMYFKRKSDIFNSRFEKMQNAEWENEEKLKIFWT
uniref:Uncharacterized protein n=1 Tax=Clytia hemisphaerica TaxID=252671 RepID=A0A7M5WY35_9CNID